jgi:hypothetical protein
MHQHCCCISGYCHRGHETVNVIHYTGLGVPGTRTTIKGQTYSCGQISMHR